MLQQSPRRYSARLRLAASRAAALLAETVRSWHSRELPDGARSGASSRTTCALVPPIPREVTPARRGIPAIRSQARSSVLTKNGLFSKSISGFGFEKLRLGGRRRFSRARTV